MYVKLFQKILDSTINETDLATRWTWITCMLLADEAGFFTATPQAIARRANISAAEVEAALKILTAPDEASTTSTDRGRRLIQTSSNSWQVVNYERYRRIASRADDREAARERMRQKRDDEKASKSGDVRFCSDSFDSVRSCSKCSASEAEAEAYTEADQITPSVSPVTGDGGKTDPEPVKNPKPEPVKLNRETFNLENLTANRIEAWIRDYPGVDVDEELAAINAWCKREPAKALKVKRWSRFIDNWMQRALADKVAGKRPTKRQAINRPLFSDVDEFERQAQARAQREQQERDRLNAEWLQRTGDA